MGLFDRLSNALKTQASNNVGDTQAGEYVESESLERDKDGNLVVRLGAGTQITLAVTSHKASDQAISELMGKPNEDFEGKTVRLRMKMAKELDSSVSVTLTTVKGHYVGWVLQSDLKLAVFTLERLTSAIQEADQIYRMPLIFDVPARVEGYWSEEESDDVPGKSVLVPDIDSVTVKLADPVKLEIRSLND